MSERKHVTIWTDGACVGNPGPGGYAAVLAHGEARREVSGGFRRTTNNRMELMAVIAALRELKYPCSVTVYSDARYVVDGVMNGAMRRWRAGGWRRGWRAGSLREPWAYPRNRPISATMSSSPASAASDATWRAV